MITDLIQLSNTQTQFLGVELDDLLNILRMKEIIIFGTTEREREESGREREGEGGREGERERKR
jgi:hypothetical protein